MDGENSFSFTRTVVNVPKFSHTTPLLLLFFTIDSNPPLNPQIHLFHKSFPPQMPNPRTAFMNSYLTAQQFFFCFFFFSLSPVRVRLPTPDEPISQTVDFLMTL